MASNPKRVRAIAVPKAGVGVTRYQLYKAAWSRVITATEAGYFLEAITLLESILTDRLESRASFLTGKNEGFQNLGPLIMTLRSCETAEEFLPIIEQIDGWRRRRNQALHEMVKFQLGEHPTWEEKLGPLNQIVHDGSAILRSFDRVDKRERRKNKAGMAATEPNAFGDDDRASVT